MNNERPPHPQHEPSAGKRRNSSDPASPAFEPVSVRPRHDGWSAEKQVALIQALAESGCVEEACRRVGKTRESAYALRRRPEAISFRNAWEAALDYGIRRLSDAAFSRALHGVATPVFFQGEQIGERRHFDERLTMFLLRYRDPLRYGKSNDLQECHGHVEGAFAELMRALKATVEDADLPAHKVSSTIRKRLVELADDAEDEGPGTPDRPERAKKRGT